eukprot:TRINITY_DN5094_c3_g1_i1.p5 TRINITY_DN5094_c3_g1~~TRINITY_DN5094_c3_g1_i1.p5  ORF type:complete len:124 (+),score=6.28 TRINITY_DN5094_c3_g1_i1:1607-1978(+)
MSTDEIGPEDAGIVEYLHGVLRPDLVGRHGQRGARLVLELPAAEPHSLLPQHPARAGGENWPRRRHGRCRRSRAVRTVALSRVDRLLARLADRSATVNNNAGNDHRDQNDDTSHGCACTAYVE